MIPPARRSAAGADHECVLIAILLYDGFSALDAVALHSMLAASGDDDAVLVAQAPGPVPDDSGRLQLTADAALHEVPLPDVVALPGGLGARRAASDPVTATWISAAAAHGARVLVVGDGARLAVEAGVDAAPGADPMASAHIHHHLRRREHR